MPLYLLRHTRVAWPQGICYGQSDVPLADTFAQELAAVQAAWPAALTDCRVRCSPLSRCVRLAEGLELSYQVDARLMELNFGAWEGKAWDDLPPEELNPWMEDFVSQAPPQGESYQQLAERAAAAWAGCQAEAPEQPWLWITHAGVIRAVLCQSRGWPLAQGFEIEVSHGAWMRGW